MSEEEARLMHGTKFLCSLLTLIGPIFFLNASTKQGRGRYIHNL